MPSFGVVATQLTDRSARPFTLTIGGLDVLGLNGSSYKTDINSIEVNEAGPNAVSSMRFTIWDPARAVTIREMDEVEFWDTTEDRPLFTGWVQDWTLSTEAVGRTIDVTCIGIEAALDWMVIPSTFTVPQNGNLVVSWQAAIGQATGVGIQLRPFSNVTFAQGNPSSSQAAPISGCGLGFDGGTLLAGVTVEEGTTLREALVLIASQAYLLTIALLLPAFVTVDFYRGVRIYNYSVSDYDDLSVTDTPATDPAAGRLDYTTDAGGVVRQVYVRGGNAAGSGLVSDGSGIPGPTAYINDASSTTATLRNGIGQGYLASFATAVRGTVDVGPWNPTGVNHRAGSQVLIYDDAMGLAADGGYIASITKRFVKGPTIRQHWSVAFGGAKPSAIRETRRLTRSTRS